MSIQASVRDSSSPQHSRESTTEPLLQATLQTQEGNADQEKDGGGGSGPRSVRFLRACDNCRRRKVKCDGGKPSCAHCNRVDAPCHYSIKPKSRRMWKCLENADDEQTTKPDGVVGRSGAGAASAGAGAAGNGAGDKVIDDLTARLLARVETMERLLMQRNGVSSPRVQSGLGMLDELGGAGSGSSGLRQQLVASVSASASASMTSLVAASMTDAAGNAAAAHAAPGANGSGHFLYNGQGGGVPTAAFSRSGSIVPSKRDNDSGPGDPGAAPHHLAGMLGTPVSCSEHACGSDTHSHHQSSSAAAMTSVPGAGGLPPLDVIKDLIDTLFSGNSYIVDLLHEGTFRRQFAAGTLAPLLLYSALASAARYSKNPAVRTDPPYSASAVFLNKAKSLVVDAMEEPSLGNAQGLMIMCMMHFSLGNETVTTFYKALALNMCILLGYNRIDSVNGPVQPASNCGHELMATSVMSMDWVDREAARRLWWTIFSIENYSSVCMGLAPSIQAEYCDVNLPATSVEWKQGRPDAAADDDESPGPAKRSRLTPNPRHQLSAYHAQLSLIFSKVAWLVTRTNSNSEDAVAQFGELNSVLQRWYEVLPKELRLSSVDTVLYGQQDSAEHHDICILHMRFYTTVIQLNHAIPEFTDDPALIEPGQRKCVIAASRISDLLRTSFEIPVEYRDINWYMCVFRAAHIHIYRLLSRDSESIARAKQDLAIHRRHLREGGPLWRICYKLLSRLDDMEQMVMLLPAQIPVADLIRLKNLTRKGKAQLVNMQLDSLIKPSLIQTENGESEDLPLLARVEMASKGQLRQPPKAVADIVTSTNGSNGFAALMNSPASSNLGSAGPPMQHPFASMPQNFEPLDMSRCTFPIDMESHVRSSIDDGQLLANNPALAGMTAAAAAAATTTSATSNGNSSSNGNSRGSDIPPINTNIVIDNNMAETLVNYFYMVASNQSQGDNSQSRRTDRSGSAVSLNSPSMMSSSGSSSGGLPGRSNQPAMGTSSLAALSAAASTTAASAASLQSFIAMQTSGSNSAGLAQMQSPQVASVPYATTTLQQQQTLPPLQNPQQQQQQQQGFFGRLYDTVDLQSIADNARPFA